MERRSSAIVGARQSPEPLTGNWVVRTDNKDGTFRTTYLNLKQEGEKITGTIRVTQFFYRISESMPGAEGRPGSDRQKRRWHDHGGQLVAVRRTSEEGRWTVWYCQRHVATIDRRREHNGVTHHPAHL